MKYTVTQNKFHGGGFISEHKTLSGALRAYFAHACATCTCGGPKIDPLPIDDTNMDAITMVDYEMGQNGLSKVEAIKATCEHFKKLGKA
jgi:hypothetical protein